MQLNKGQATQAVATFQVVLANKPDDGAALNGLGWAYRQMPGKEAEAKEAFEKAIKGDPKALGAMKQGELALTGESATAITWDAGAVASAFDSRPDA